MTLLIGLIFRELFEFRLMQTDPNFANYRYAPATGQVMLLDFGATRAFPAEFADLYRRLLRAGLAGDRPGVRAAALQIGFLAPDTPPQLEKAMLEMLEMSLQPMRQDAAFDFGASDLAMRMRDSGMAMAEDREHFRIPPMDTLFLQRKFGGIYMLATGCGRRSICAPRSSRIYDHQAGEPRDGQGDTRQVLEQDRQSLCGAADQGSGGL